MSDDLVERLRAWGVLRHGSFQTEVIFAEAVTRITELQAELAEARVELAGLKDVPDRELIELGAKAIRTLYGDGGSTWEKAAAVIGAIASSLITRGVEKERERAATECAAVADKHRGYANLAALEAACECLELIRAGAAP